MLVRQGRRAAGPQGCNGTGELGGRSAPLTRQPQDEAFADGWMDIRGLTGSLRLGLIPAGRHFGIGPDRSGIVF